MVFEFVIDAYTKYKTIFFTSLVITVTIMIDNVERYILLDNIAIIKSENSKKPELKNYTCFNSSYEDYRSDDDPGFAKFYWSEGTQQAVFLLHFYSPIVTIVFAGNMADRYGGHWVAFVGLVYMGTCLVSYSLYISLFSYEYLFIVMVVLRRIGTGVIWQALISLPGKLVSASHQITTFVSILLAGGSVGHFFGYIITEIIKDNYKKGNIWNYKTISAVPGFISYVTALWWWWMICRDPQFTRVRRVSRFPWKAIMKSVSLYVICLLIGSASILHNVLHYARREYSKNVLFFNGKQGTRNWAVMFNFRLVGAFSYLACGASTDYIITKRYLTASVTRRFYVSLCFVIILCTLIVLKMFECDHLLFLGCLVALRYSVSFMFASVIAAAIEFSPLYSGTILGIAFTFGIFLEGRPTGALRNKFVSGNSKFDASRWSLVFFTLAFLALFLSLPFICFGIKRRRWGSRTSRRTRTVTETGHNINQR